MSNQHDPTQVPGLADDALEEARSLMGVTLCRQDDEPGGTAPTARSCKANDMPVSRSVFPDVDFAPVAEAFGFQAATVRTLDELRMLAPLLAEPDGPILLDCKINAAVAAPFMDEAARAPELGHADADLPTAGLCGDESFAEG